MKLEIKKFEDLSNKEVYEILNVRSIVFAIEQNSVYNDTDGKDLECTHLMIKENNKIIAYLRVLKAGLSYDDPSIGRVLVVSEARGRGLARKLVQAAIDYIITEWNEEQITIGAQSYLRTFYENLGFKAVSDVYIGNNIPHIDMVYKKK